MVPLTQSELVGEESKLTLVTESSLSRRMLIGYRSRGQLVFQNDCEDNPNPDATSINVHYLQDPTFFL